MKNFKWKIFLITSIVCLLPILGGVMLWKKLPDEIAIHFNLYGNPDNYASKGFVVFALPIFMALMQTVVCLAIDLELTSRGKSAKLEAVSKWIIPFVTIALMVLTLGIALDYKINVQKSVMIIMSVLFIVVGSFLPGYDYVKNFKMSPEKAKKFNSFMGRGMIVLGILFLIGAFLPPRYGIALILLVIPYSLISFIYAIIIAKRP